MQFSDRYSRCTCAPSFAYTMWLFARCEHHFWALAWNTQHIYVDWDLFYRHHIAAWGVHIALPHHTIHSYPYTFDAIFIITFVVVNSIAIVAPVWPLDIHQFISDAIQHQRQNQLPTTASRCSCIHKNSLKSKQTIRNRKLIRMKLWPQCGTKTWKINLFQR